MTEEKNGGQAPLKSKKKREKRKFASKKEKVIYEIKSWTIIILAVWIIRTMIFCNYIIPTGSMENTMMTGTFVIGNQFYYGAQTPHKIAIPFSGSMGVIFKKPVGFMLPHIKLPAIKKPQTGDIVIFEYPQERLFDYVKRCIGTPGSTIEIKDKRVYVDGRLFEDPPKSNINYNYIRPENSINPQIWPPGNGNQDQYRALYIPKKGDVINLDSAHPDYAYNIMTLDGQKVSYRFGNWYIKGERVREYEVKQDFYFLMGDNRDNSADSRFWGLVPYKYIKGKPTAVQFLLWDKTWKKALVITAMGLLLFYAFFWDGIKERRKKTGQEKK
ncbi:MAG: signal peptidase I [Candidatus Marinimicrobia bacterium]|jgi:signal peptidase I|nr:signal peptidase I [Candidatus Neomarinimicrobiota bacterium]MDD4961702.1 signal peptidase I [Candidatus Neomarinimicrobiota bacterium]MDD5709736.1 signal peptidase I [Candidatus Neomarinimicrobiota bacterium]MDX9777797.1 signal peptidase I [bacterium]